MKSFEGNQGMCLPVSLSHNVCLVSLSVNISKYHVMSRGTRFHTLFLNKDKSH